MASDLPEIDDPVVIDGSSQPGNSEVCSEAIADRPDYGVVVDGDGVAAAIFELQSGSGSSTIQGLNLRGATSNGILAVGGVGGHTIRCNFIGTDETGLVADANGVGIAVASAGNVTIGGTDPGDGNLISGNTSQGIFLLGAGASGIVQGNFIGTDKTGAADLGNGGSGIELLVAAGTVTVGGTGDGEGNVIAYNANGLVDTTDTTGHTVRGNSIFSNTGLGIDLGNDGATANDEGDADSGANELQNSPHLLDATAVNGVLSIGYLVDSETANQTYPLAVDFYLADADGEEGSEYLGSATYGAADAQLPARMSFDNPGTVGGGDLIVATATDADGNTSEFSASVEVNAFLVESTADSGVGSLRQAILNANAVSGLNWVTTAISGDGPHVIAATASMPTLTQPVILDGSMQAGNETVCTDAVADRGAYQIVLDGTDVADDAFVIEAGADGSTIQGLNIRNFGENAVFFDESSDNVIRCNFIGTDEEGAAAMGNAMGLYVAGGDDNVIGGSDPGDGNLISGHVDGISPLAGSGILFANGDTDGALIQGNTLGTDKSGASDLGNTVGIHVDASNSTVINVLIGGVDDGEGNVIAWNGDGVFVGQTATQVSIFGNSFYSNDNLGIDLLIGGVSGATANDSDDVDESANRGQNFPVVSADASSGDVVVTYEVDTDTANATYPITVEFFLADDSTNAQGETSLGLAEYTAGDYGDCGAAPCTATVDLGTVADLELTATSEIIATATDADGNTSELSTGSAIAGLVDLTVSVAESADPVVPGSGAGNLVYTVTVTNASLVAATGVVLDNSLTLPTGVSAVSQVPSTGSFSGTTWTLGTLAAGASETLTVTVTAAAATAAGTDVITDTASVTAVDQTDTDASNDTASESTSTARLVDLAVSVSESADPAVAGSGAGNLVYTVTVTNAGPSDATGVTLANVLTLPTGVTADSQVPSSGSFSGTTWTVGPLPAGGSATLTATLTVGTTAAEGTDTITDTATLTAVDETDSDAGNNSASESTSVVRQVDLDVSVSESIDPVIAGSSNGNLVYTATVTNNGPVAATGVTLDSALTLAAGVTADSQVPSAGSFSGDTWTLGSLASGDSETLTITLTVGSSAATGTDVVSAAVAVTAVDEADTDDSNDSNSESTSIARLVDVTVSVAESTDPVVAGSGTDNLVYTITVTNDGASDATGVALETTLTLPSAVTVESQVPSTGSFSDPTWTVGSLAPGDSETLTITLTVDSAAAEGTDVVTSAVALTAVNETDADDGDDTASESTSIAREIDLAVSVTESTDPVVAGSGTGNLVYVVTVTNDGPSQASGVELENALTLPSAVTADSQVPSTGSFSDPTWTVGTLAPGDSETLTVTLTVGAAADEGTDVITDAASVTAVDETDTEPTNDDASESTSIELAIDLAVTVNETTGVSEVLLGEGLVYEITVSNNASDAADVVLIETVPDQTTYDAGSSDAGWQCLPDSAAGSTCTFEVGALDGGEESSATFAVLVDSAISRDVTEIVNAVSVGTEGGDVDATPADNTDEISTAVDLPPIVEAVDTVASTVDGALRDGEGPRVPVTQILLQFSEEVTGAGASASFLVVEAGADGTVSSSCAGGILDDDQQISIDSTVYDESGLYDGPTSRLGLGAGLPLGQGRYRVLACGDAIEDSAGQLLDGDLDDAVDGDFALDFLVGASSLIENPNFDEALAPWSSLDFAHDSDDVDEAPSSGSAEALPTTDGVLTHPCIEIDTVEAGLFASMAALVRDPDGVTPSVQIELEFFTDSACQDTLLATESVARVEGATGSEWLQPSEWRAIPDSAQSVRPSVRYEASDASGSAFVDRVSLIPMLYGDGFESGDTSAWSSESP